MLVFVCMLLGATSGMTAQTSVQNFGTGTGTHSSQTGSTSFIPSPTSGTSYARAGNPAANSVITLANTPNVLGSTGSYVKGAASTTTSISRISPVVGYTGSTEFYTSYKVMFGDINGASANLTGNWAWYMGSGAMYSNNTEVVNAEVFTGLRFTYGNGTITLASRQGTSFVATNLTNTAYNQATVYTIEIIGNNKSSGTINYNYAGAAQSVAVQRVDVYINGTLIGNDLAVSSLSSGSNVNSMTFNGVSSTASGANIFIDDVTVYNAVPAFINVAAPIIPNEPVVSNPQTNSLDVTIDTNAQNGNGATIAYAIHETTTNTYVQADGTLGATPVWQTAATWGTVVVNGLNSNTGYTFELNARNVANTESGFGPTASGTTLENLAANLSLVSPLADFGNVCTNTTETGSFTFDGANLDGTDIVLNGPAGYSFSLTQNGTYAASLNISYVGSSINDQVVWVQFAPTLVQSYDGSIALTGGNLAAAYNVAVAGEGINSPVAVTTGSASGVSAAQATAAGSLVEGCTSVTAYGIEYSTTGGFANGTGTQVASNNLSAGAFSAALTGLSANTPYYFKAYATDGTGTVYGTQQTFTTAELPAPDATAATAVQQTQFTANWEPVDGASSYRLDVSTLPTFGTTQLTADLLFSEYVEGSSSNKYIEIYNGTGGSVNLSDYQLRLFANGDPISSPTTTVTLSGTLANGATIVYKNGSASVYGGAATTNGAINFNGDDAIGLYKISTASFVDIFGTIGQDPGSAWTATGFSTVDKTLVRKPTVFSGITTNPGNGFPALATEWIQSNIDVVSNLGSHTINNFTPSFITGYENLTVNGTSQVVSGPEIVAETTYHYRVRAFSASSTSGNSDVIDVTTLQASPTFGAITQVVAVVCDGSDATFNVTGLLPDVMSAITFNINGGTPVVVNVAANASGFGSFDYTLVAANNGQVLTVTSVDRVDFPGSPITPVSGNTVALSVNAYETYYRDFDNDTYGDAAVTIQSCDGAPAGYIANNTDCDDDNNAAHTIYPYFEDVDGDGYGNTTVVNICAANPLVAPTGFSTNDDDCNDNAASAYPGAAEIGYNLVDDDCDGSIDEGFPPKITIIQGAQCNTTLAAIDTQIMANIVAGAQGYRWRVTTLTGPSAGQQQTLDTGIRVMKLTQLLNYAFGTQYKVEVAVYYAGFLQPYNPSNCNVTTPNTTTQLSACGQSLTAMSNAVYANIVPYAAGYRFRITDPVNPLNTQVLERSIREFKMTQITNFFVQYNKLYNVEVSVKNTDGTWLPYGAMCTVTTPAFPTTSVQDSQCEDYAVPTNSTLIYALSYPGAINYVFQINGPGLVSPLEVTKTTRVFTLNDFPGLVPGATYDVKVRLVFNLADPAGPYGKTCTIVTPGLSRTVPVKSAFDVTAYPNPFADNFSIGIVGASAETVGVKVYDMTGRMLDNVTVKVAELDNFGLGNAYPSGVYNVVVTQGENSKTVRLIKR